MSGSLALSRALPFLTRLPDSALTAIRSDIGFPADNASFLRTDIPTWAGKAEIRTVSNAIATTSLDAVVDERLGDIVPPIWLLAGQMIMIGQASRRLVNLLGRYSIVGWHTLAECTLAYIHSMRNGR